MKRFLLSLFLSFGLLHTAPVLAATSVQDVKEPSLELAFTIDIKVDKPLLVGQDQKHGRRQLVSITGGKVNGKLNGEVLPYGVDS